MSTQQQIDQYNAVIQQKQQERAGQETILRIQQEQLAKAENARVDAELAVQRARSSGASAEQIEALQRQARLADQAESDARIAASKTSSNIENLDGSIRFNTSQRDQFQASLPAQGVPASTADDVAVNEQTNVAEVAPAPVPATDTPAPVDDFVTDPVTGEQVPSDSDRAAEIRAEAATAQEQVQTNAPAPVPDSTQAEGNAGEAEAAAPDPGAPGTLDPQQRAANEQAAAKANAINQATLNSVYKKEGSADWRVRLQLAPTSNYLYNDKEPGILQPLVATNGIIFPYTPAINTSYKANYEQYDLVHSNYRGVYYKNSRVDDLNIRGTFTAQDTNEANYLLAVIHFFRSVTKMFYGKDEQRGTPPPLVYLSGLGMNQFYGHPCVVSNFTYNLPDNVDYIRATTVNNYGTDLLSRRTASSPSSISGLGATGNRLLNAGLANFNSPAPTPSSVVANVNNTQLANYVPTKMEIDITLIPVQTRSQVSKQFSLKGFANGDLIKGGYW